VPATQVPPKLLSWPATSDLPDSLDRLMPLVMKRIPSGVGQGHKAPVAQERLAALSRPRTQLSAK
jgi:hypothetical protein